MEDNLKKLKNGRRPKNNGERPQKYGSQPPKKKDNLKNEMEADLNKK
jgi:hypothetical protein